MDSRVKGSRNDESLGFHCLAQRPPLRRAWKQSQNTATRGATTAERIARTFCALTLTASLAGFCGQNAAAKNPTDPIEYNRDIRPILSSKCFPCHGPDDAARQADLLLHRRQETLRDRGGYRVLVPGRPTESELFRRISSDDESEKMPPVDSGKHLSHGEIDVLRRWIAAGAQYQKHWSFLPPKRSEPPEVEYRDWPRNPLDHFVLSRLEGKSLRPAPEAERAMLLRRVTFALTGLPPSLDELDCFLADGSDRAYEKAVDRLLASPRYGEHRARYWLDAARYADTNGFFTDDARSMWRWRDWVIDAFNRNMPFDQFTVEQLAGDLLPSPSEAQQIATGFNRNHMTMYETGVIDEEYRVEYVVDRLETMSTIWLGLTIGCARCHDHKFDPVSQQDFYRLFAFFNTVAEKGIAKGTGNAPPVLQIPNAEFLAELAALEQRAAEADASLKELQPQLVNAQADWLATASKSPLPPPTRDLVACFKLDGHTQDAAAGAHHAQAIGRIEFSSGMLGNAARFDGDSLLELDGALHLGRADAFSYGAWIRLESGRPACVLSKNDDVNNLRGFDLMIRKGRAVVHLIHKWNSDAIQVTAKLPVESNRWKHLMVTYDGSSRADGVRIYFDGLRQEVQVNHDHLRGSIHTDQPLRIGRRSTSAPFVGLIDDVRIYRCELTEKEVWQLATGQVIRGAGSIPDELRTDDQRNMLRQLYISNYAPPRLKQVYDRAAEAKEKLEKQRNRIPTVMVMREMDQPRETFLLMRGQYDAPGEVVSAAVPASLPPLPADAVPNRLSLAHWLVSPAHPLTARVTVNRLWQQLFGTGIVKTAGDFGSQGEWPSHPELLDWLAVELVASGWDLKHVQRLIVTSATYRQSSHVFLAAEQAADKAAPDPNDQIQESDNHLLTRGPRFRLDAEVVRDNALAVSGLLVESTEGPSVKPYQPSGMWAAVSFDGKVVYEQDHGESLYRRGLYTFWKRQSPPPAMLIFDAPTRETCTVRRARTNTPLQALTLLNDTTFVEAARALAERMMTETSGGPLARLRRGFRLATSRLPRQEEQAVLLDVYHKQLDYFGREVDAAVKLLSVGEAPRDRSLDPVEHAAWTLVASILLNLDETISSP